MLRQCIRCLKFKRWSNDPEQSEFNDEHVFPETIGGAFLIPNMCKKCNSELGKLVDTPFVNSPKILFERNRYNLTRDGRDIQNPFKGRIYESNGKKYKIDFDENGNIVRHFFPVLPSKGTVLPGEKFTISFDVKDEANVPEMIQKFLKRNGLSAAVYIQGEPERTHHPEEERTETSPNAPIMLGLVKIAYEFTATYIPSYIDDELAAEYRRTLEKGEFSEKITELINPPKEILLNLAEVIGERIYIPDQESHWAFLFYAPNVGLMCIVKIFDIANTFIMSVDKRFNAQTFFLGVNNFITSKYQLFTLGELTHTHLELKTNTPVSPDTTIDIHNTPLYYSQNEIFAKCISEISSYSAP